MTRRITITVIIIITCIFSPILYCYEINQFTKPVPCSAQNSVCSAIDIASYFIFQSVGPPVCMLIFGFGTLLHIRQGRRLKPEAITSIAANVLSTVANNRINNQKTNQANIRLLFTQVVVYLLCSIPLFAIKIYMLIPLSIVRSDVRISVEALLLNITLWFSLVDKIFSFYIYTLSSKYFRQGLIKLVRKHIQQRSTGA
ncbi:hypothetical protein I4U23_027289 [Adineta vaga]|nr:hypothetical protein I4U23_027289 [Adineta vaga]